MTSPIFTADARRMLADLSRRVGILERRRTIKAPAGRDSLVEEPFILNLDIESETLLLDASFHAAAPTFSSAGGEFVDIGYLAQGTLTVGPLEIAGSGDDPDGLLRFSLRCGLGCRATREPWAYSAQLIVSNVDCTERLEAHVDDVDIGAIETDDGTIDLPVEADWDVSTTGSGLVFDYSIGTVTVVPSVAGIYWVTFAVDFRST